MTVRRIFALLLIAFMLFPMFASCNGDDDNKDTENSQDESESNSDNDASKDDDSKDDNVGKEDAAERDWKDDNALKILTIGNSFSDDTMEYVYKIAKSAGVENVKLGNLYIGGCSLDTHATNAKNNSASYEYRTNSADSWVTTKNYRMRNALKSEDWDFISLQQVSGSSGIASSYAQLEYMINYVKTLCPGAKLVWNMTWAYQQDSTHGSFANYGNDQMAMYQDIVATVKSKIVTNKNISVIVPNGTAIQNARTSYVGDKLTRDGYHLSLDFGRYIAGLTFFHAVTGISIKDIEYMPAGVDENLQKIAIEASLDAIANPYDVIASAYKDIPTFDSSKYERIELDWTALGYYNTDLSGEPNTIVTDATNSNQFYASKLFTKEELPVGSIIVLADGWKYRPEGWVRGSQSRPGEVSIGYIVIAEAWWGSYTERGFNLSKVKINDQAQTLTDVTQAEIDAAFIIYVSKA